MLSAALLFLVSNYSLFTGQFTGEDEALQWWVCRQIISGFSQRPFVEALHHTANLLISEYHPPLRYLLSLPGVLLFPHLEFGLRMLAIAGSGLMTVLLSLFSFRVYGRESAKWTALLISASGIYVWTSMAFAWSWLVVFLILALFCLWDPAHSDLRFPGNLRRVWWAFACLFGAYLINSGAILFSVGLVLMLLFRNYRNLPKLILAGIPVLGVYGLYWLLFLVLPPHSGQLAQTVQRSGMGGWTITSFIENLQGWNAYGLPLLFNLLWITGFAVCFHKKRVAVWLPLPFCLGWSFYLQGQSHQYFLLGSLPWLALGLGFAAVQIKTGPVKYLFLILVLAWNISLFQIPYPATHGSFSTAHPWLLTGKGVAGRYHNAREPWREIADFLHAQKPAPPRYIDDLDGPFNIFYYPGEPGRIGRLDSESFPAGQPEIWDPAPEFILTRQNLESETYVLERSFEFSNVKIYKHCRQK